jgi:hypothetical protein
VGALIDSLTRVLGWVGRCVVLRPWEILFFSLAKLI